MALKDIKIDAEYLDVLDEKGKSLGIKKSKDEVHRDGDWHATIQVWTINSEGQTLMQKRATTKQSSPGAWDHSCAGHISTGENPDDAVLREFEEELGIKIKLEDLNFMFFHKIQHIEQNGKYLNNQINHLYLIIKDINIDAIILDQNEVSEVKWFDFDELIEHVENETMQFCLKKDDFKSVLKRVKIIAQKKWKNDLTKNN